MDLFRRLVGKGKDPNPPPPEAAVIQTTGAHPQGVQRNPNALSATIEASLANLTTTWRAFETDTSHTPEAKRHKHFAVLDAFLDCYEVDRVPFHVIQQRFTVVQTQFAAAASVRLCNEIAAVVAPTSKDDSVSNESMTIRAIHLYQMLSNDSHLLAVLFILAQELPPDECEVLVDTGLPSILVHAFLTLLHLPPESLDAKIATSTDKRQHARPEEFLINLLLQLCSTRIAISELIHSDALGSLFLAPMCGDAKHVLKSPLRDRILPVAMTVVKYHVDVEIVTYLIKKHLVNRMVSALINDLTQHSPGSLVDMLKFILKLLETTSPLADAPLLEFKKAQGYPMLATALQLFEQQAHTSLQATTTSSELTEDEQRLQFGEQLLAALSDFVYVGTRDLYPEPDLSMTSLSSEKVHQPASAPVGESAWWAGQNPGGSSTTAPTNVTPSSSWTSPSPVGALRDTTFPSSLDSAYTTPEKGGPFGDPSQGPLIRNVDAFQVYQNYFMTSENEYMKQHVVEFIAGIFNSNPVNFRLVQHLHTIAHFLEDLPNQRESTRESVTRLLLFVVTALNCVPFHELVALSCLLQEYPILDDVSLVRQVYQTVVVMIKFESSFRSVLTRAGLMDVLASLLRRFEQQAKLELDLPEKAPPVAAAPVKGSPKTAVHRRASRRQTVAKQAAAEGDSPMLGGAAAVSTGPLPISEAYNIIMDIVTLLLEESPDNVQAFKQRDCMRVLYYLIVNSPKARLPALLVLSQVIKEDRNHNEREVNRLVEMMQTSSDLALRRDILDSFTKLFGSNPETRRVFRDSGGFVCAVSALVYLEGRLSNPDAADFDFHLDMLFVIFKTLIGVIAGDRESRLYLSEQIGFGTLSQSVVYSGVFKTRPALAMSWFLDLATEYPNISIVAPTICETDVERQATGKIIYNPWAIVPILDALPSYSADFEALEASLQFPPPTRHSIEDLDALAQAEPINDIQLATDFFTTLNDIFAYRVSNLEAISKLCLVDRVVSKYRPFLLHADSDVDAALNETAITSGNAVQRVRRRVRAFGKQLLKLVTSLGSYKLSTTELSSWFSLMQPAASTSVPALRTLLRTFLKMCNTGHEHNNIPFVFFDLSKLGYASMTHSLQNIVWPPADGYTLSLWIYLDHNPRQEDVEIFKVTSYPPEPKHDTAGSGTTASGVSFGGAGTHQPPLTSLRLVLQRAASSPSGKPVLVFTCSHARDTTPEVMVADSTVWERRRWYHIAIVHERHRFQMFGSSETKLYVDGVLCSSIKMPSGNSQNSRIVALFGTPPNPSIIFQGPQPRPLQWRLGPFHLIEGACSYTDIHLMSNISGGYAGNWSGSLAEYLSHDVITSRFLTTIELLSSVNSSSGGNISSLGTALAGGLGTLASGLYNPSAPGVTLASNGALFSQHGAGASSLRDIDLPSVATLSHPSQVDQILLSVSAPRLLTTAPLFTHAPSTLQKTAESSSGAGDDAIGSSATGGAHLPSSSLVGIAVSVRDTTAGLDPERSAAAPPVPTAPVPADAAVAVSSIIAPPVMYAVRDGTGRATCTSVSFDSDDSPTLCWPAPIHLSLYKTDGLDALLALLEFATQIDRARVLRYANVTSDSSLTLLVLRCIRAILYKNAQAQTEFSLRHGFETIARLLATNAPLLTLDQLLLIFEIVGVPSTEEYDEGGSMVKESSSSSLTSSGRGGAPWSSRVASERERDRKRDPGSNSPLGQLSTRSVMECFTRAVIADMSAFKFLVMNYSLWRGAPTALQLQLLHCIDMLTTTSLHRRFNITRMRKMHIVNMLLNVLRDEQTEPALFATVIRVLANIMRFSLEEDDVRQLLQFAVYTLNHRVLANPRGNAARRFTQLRNMVLNLLLELVIRAGADKSAFLHVLDPHWIFVFIQPTCHSLTVVIVCKILAELYRADKRWATRFRNSEGFTFLRDALPKFHEHPEIYYVMFSLVFGRSVTELPGEGHVSFGTNEFPTVFDAALSLDSAHRLPDFSLLFDAFKPRDEDKYKFHCREALDVILAMLKKSSEYVATHPPFKSSSSSGTNSSPTSRHFSPAAQTRRPGGGRNSIADVPRPRDFEDISSSPPSASASTTRASPTKITVPTPEQFAQGHLISFLHQTFTWSKNFQEALWKGSKVEEACAFFVDIVFPQGKLNMRQSLAQDAKAAPLSPEKDVFANPVLIQWSDALFQLLNHFLETIAIHAVSGNHSYLRRNSKNAGPSIGAAIANSLASSRDVFILSSILDIGPPAAASERDVVRFTTRILDDLLKEFSKASAMQRAVKANPKVSAALAKAIAFIVDKVALGYFPQDHAHPLFDFLVTFMDWALFDEAAPRVDMSSYFKSLNRLVVMMLHYAEACLGVQLAQTSSPYHSSYASTAAYVPEAAVAVLDRIIRHQRPIFAGANQDSEFIAAVCKVLYTLLQSSASVASDVKIRTMTLWKLLLLTKTDMMDRLLIVRVSKEELRDLRTDGFSLLLQKDFSEFSAWFYNNPSKIAQVLDDTLNRFGATNWDKNETKLRQDKVSTFRSARRERARMSGKLRQARDVALQTIGVTIGSLQAKQLDAELTKFKQYKQVIQDGITYLTRMWDERRTSLVSDRGLWGPYSWVGGVVQVPRYPYNLDRWVLDETEGPLRMRKKLRRDPDFYSNYPYIGERVLAVAGQDADDADDSSFAPTRIPTSKDSHAMYIYSQNVRQTRQREEDRARSWRRASLPFPSLTASIAATRVLTDVTGATTSRSSSPSRRNAELARAAAGAISTADALLDPNMRRSSSTSDVSSTSPPSDRSFMSPLRSKAFSVSLPDIGNALDSDGGYGEQESPRTLDDLSSESDSYASEDERDMPFAMDLHGSGSASANTTASAASSGPDESMSSDDDPSSSDESGMLASSADGSSSGGLVVARLSISMRKNSTTSIDDEGEPMSPRPLGEDDPEDGNDPDAIGAQLATSQTLLEDVEENEDKIKKLLEPGDDLLHVYNCGRVEGLDNHSGILLICKRNVYVIDYYHATADGDIEEVDIVTTPVYTIHEIRQKQALLLQTMIAATDTAGAGTTPAPVANVQPLILPHPVLRWAHDDLVQVLKRRYLLRPVALEIFAVDGRNSLLVFDSTSQRDQIVDKLTHFGPQLSREVPLKELTDMWVNGQLSNFDYLMRLNTRAGRSYNDLTQYPVFPWVLADYQSQRLDLTAPECYRDLSLPMGALDAVRREKFLARYEALDDDVPRFHYGSHYSTSGVVLHFLIRMEPFTRHFLKLQGGRFDHPDRLFHSVADAWMSASAINTMDVKELVPEFYYLPEFLQNANRFDLGRKQSTGEWMDHVVLPPWAYGSPRLFVKRMRQALESDIVSERLNHWIDLIFGYKQQGDAAAEAMNLFYYLTYEGAVNIDQIADPIARQGTIDQINNYGQTPGQLFKKPHPKRNASTQISTTLFSLPLEVIQAQPMKSTSLSPGTSVGLLWVQPGGDRVVAIERYRALLPPASNSSKQIAWGYDDMCLRILDGDRILSVASNVHHRAGFITCLATDGKYVVSGGSDGVVCVYNMTENERGRPKLQRLAKGLLTGHTAAITAIAVSRAFSIIASADAAGNLMLWDLNTLTYMRTVVSPTLGVGESIGAASGSRAAIDIIKINELTGDIAECAGTTLVLWSINGDLIASKQTTLSQSITSFVMSQGPEWAADANVYVTGHKDGTIRVWKLVTPDESPDASTPLPQNTSNTDTGLTANSAIFRLELHKRLDKQHQGAVTALAFSTNLKRLYSGDSNGNVVRWEELPPTPGASRNPGPQSEKPSN